MNARRTQGRWFGGEPGNRVVGSPGQQHRLGRQPRYANRGPRPNSEDRGFVQDDGSLLLDLGAMGGGAEIRGTLAENGVLVMLPTASSSRVNWIPAY